MARPRARTSVAPVRRLGATASRRSPPSRHGRRCTRRHRARVARLQCECVFQRLRCHDVRAGVAFVEQGIQPGEPDREHGRSSSASAAGRAPKLAGSSRVCAHRRAAAAHPPVRAIASMVLEIAAARPTRGPRDAAVGSLGASARAISREQRRAPRPVSPFAAHAGPPRCAARACVDQTGSASDARLDRHVVIGDRFPWRLPGRCRRRNASTSRLALRTAGAKGVPASSPWNSSNCHCRDNSHSGSASGGRKSGSQVDRSRLRFEPSGAVIDGFFAPMKFSDAADS